MKPKSKRIIFLSACLGLLLVANFSSAALINCGNNLIDSNGQYNQQTFDSNACKMSDLFLSIKRIINFLLSWAWLVAVLFIAWAGWDMVNAGGNPQAIQKGKTGLSNAIIGFFLVIAAFLLLNMIVYFLTGTKFTLRDIFNFLP
jgi:hypothetical protein